MDVVLGFVSFLFVMAILVVVFTVTNFLKKSRTLQIQRIAQQLGFTYDADARRPDARHRFKLFCMSHSESTDDLIWRKDDGVTITHFEYTYTIDRGDDRERHYRQTVTLFEAKSLSIPTFFLRPEKLLDRVGEFLMAENDIDFRENRTFSDGYHLTGENPEAVRTLFEGEIIQHLSKWPGYYCIEARGGCLLVYTPNRVVAPKEIPATIQERLEIFNLFRAKLLGRGASSAGRSQPDFNRCGEWQVPR